jgi:hypothetical protein
MNTFQSKHPHSINAQRLSAGGLTATTAITDAGIHKAHPVDGRLNIVVTGLDRSDGVAMRFEPDAEISETIDTASSVLDSSSFQAGPLVHRRCKRSKPTWLPVALRHESDQS